MASIVIYGIGVSGNESGDNLNVFGSARCTGMAQNDTPVDWTTVVSPDDSVASISAAIKSAAIAAAADEKSITVGLLDKKTIVGGGVLGL